MLTEIKIADIKRVCSLYIKATKVIFGLPENYPQSNAMEDFLFSRIETYLKNHETSISLASSDNTPTVPLQELIKKFGLDKNGKLPQRKCYITTTIYPDNEKTDCGYCEEDFM